MQAQNAKLAGWQAADAEKRGAVTEAKYAQQAAAQASSQRAALAGSGVDIAGGSAFDLQEDTKRATDLDLSAIRQNVAREAFGIRINQLDAQASSTLSKFQAQSISPAQNAGVTLLGGSAQVGQQWYRYKADQKAAGATG